MQNSVNKPRPVPGEPSPPAGPAAKASGPESRVERLPGVHLDLEVGSILTIKLPPAEQKFECRLLGMDTYSYLIVQARLPQDAVARLASNPNLVAQHLASGTVYGFRTVVLNRVTVPAPILFLSFPDAVERVVLRRNERVSVSLHGTLHGQYGDHDIMLTDLAPKGCQITAAAVLRSPLREAKPGDELILECDLGRGRMLLTPVKLCRVEEAKGLLSLGCQFVRLEEEMSKMINEFVQSVLKFMRN